jgi:predicted O-methyltransferase YrrM
MSRNTFTMSAELYQYYLKNSLREAPVLAALRAETAKLSSAKMQIAPEQGQFMAFLVQLLSAKKTIDIGVYTGYSSLVVAMALPNEAQVVACDINVEWTNMAKKYWKLAGQDHKITFKLGPALNTLDNLINNNEQETFDFIFIDADKKSYQDYYERSLTLLRPGGIIAIDNVLWDGRVADLSDQDESTVAIRAFNQELVQDLRIDLTMIPIADGLSLVRKKDS